MGAKKVLGGLMPDPAILATGTAVVLFAAFCFIAAVWREVWSGAPPPKTDVRRMPRSMLVLLNGFLVLVCLAALLGMRFRRTGSG